MINGVVVACGALAIALLILGFVIWFIKKHPEEAVPFWAVVASLIVALVDVAILIAL